MDVDVVARRLARWGAKARSMPRGAFEHEGDTHPLVTSRGARLGRLVPGHGLAIDADLKKLGITRPVPGVIERTPWMRLLDALAGDRGAITTLATLRSASGRTQYTWADTFNVNGFAAFQQFEPSSAGVTFASAGTVAPTARSPAGAYNSALRDPPAGIKKYLTGVSQISTAGGTHAFGMAVYVDVLSVFGSLACDSVASQTVNSAALTRRTSGAGVYFLYAVATGGTVWVTPPNPTVTTTYTNQSGTGSRTSVFSTDSATSGQIMLLFSVADNAQYNQLFCPFQSGDYGIRSIQSVQLSIAGSAATTFGGFLFRPLVFLHACGETNVSIERDARAEPEMLVEFDVDASNVLGYHTMLQIPESSSGSSGTAVFTFDTCEA